MRAITKFANSTPAESYLSETVTKFPINQSMSAVASSAQVPMLQLPAQISPNITTISPNIIRYNHQSTNYWLVLLINYGKVGIQANRSRQRLGTNYWYNSWELWHSGEPTTGSWRISDQPTIGHWRLTIKSTRWLSGIPSMAILAFNLLRHFHRKHLCENLGSK